VLVGTSGSELTLMIVTAKYSKAILLYRYVPKGRLLSSRKDLKRNFYKVTSGVTTKFALKIYAPNMAVMF